MAMAATLPGRDLAVTPRATAGRGEIRFASVGGRTVLTRAYAASPLKILNPDSASTSARVYLATYGGGLVDGDAIDVHIDVGPGAAALVTTQAATKVYRSPRGTSQTVNAHVSDEALLVLLPDPVACFAAARYTQQQQILLEPRANLVLVDRLTAGRIESGERWLFDEFTSRTFIRRGDRLLLHDALRLSRDDGEVALRLGRFNALALIVLVGPALAATARHLAGTFAAGPALHRPDILCSAAPLGDEGVLLRVASRSVERLAGLIRQHLSVLESLLEDDPWIGK
jgi:urease accessory protein